MYSDENLKVFAMRAKELRESKGLSIRMFSLQLGRTSQLISGIERGTRKPDLLLIRAYSDFFKVSFGYLLDMETKNELPRETQDELHEETQKDLSEEVKDVPKVEKADSSLFAERLKETRLNRKLSFRKLRELTGCTIETLWKYENGYTAPKAKIAKKISDALGISLEWLMGTKSTNDIFIELFNDLSDKHKNEVMSYAEYLKSKEH